MTASEKAVVHLLQRVQRDPRLAYYIGPFTESLNLLLAAGAEITGADPVAFAAEIDKTIRTERPGCSQCKCPDCRREG